METQRVLASHGEWDSLHNIWHLPRRVDGVDLEPYLGLAQQCWHTAPLRHIAVEGLELPLGKGVGFYKLNPQGKICYVRQSPEHFVKVRQSIVACRYPSLMLTGR